MKKVEIYTTPTCHFCKAAKEFFAEKNVPFTNYDVATDAEKRADMIELTGQLGVPVIVIDNEAVVGFNRDIVAGKLGLAP